MHTLTPAPGVRFDRNHLDLRAADMARTGVTGMPEGVVDPAAIEVRA
ncbi:hypothetical protein ABZX40_31725 [Streptomyces sp. NPDC004610]